MSERKHWSVKNFQKLRPALGQYTSPVVTELMESVEGMEGSDLSLLEIAVFFTPEPIGLAHVYQRGPYANPDMHKQRLEGARDRGWLENRADSSYGPSQKGLDFYTQVAAAYYAKLAEVESIAAGQLEKIDAALSIVVKTARESTQVMHKPALVLTMKEPLPDDASGLRKVQLYSEQMLAFRDDAHVASWSPYKLEGIVWESLSDIWEETAGTPTEMAEKRPFRGYDEKDYASAFAALVEREWTAEADGRYIITDEGRKIREKAEKLTNQYYDSAWEGLSEADEQELEKLFKLLLDKHEPEPVPA